MPKQALDLSRLGLLVGSQVRAPSSHGGGRWFESCVAHFATKPVALPQKLWQSTWLNLLSFKISTIAAKLEMCLANRLNEFAYVVQTADTDNVIPRFQDFNLVGFHSLGHRVDGITRPL
jgi:hypothetical protein